MSHNLRKVACPIALHPDGAPQRVPLFEPPQTGTQLVKGDINVGARPETAAARKLFEESGLETRAALLLGQSDAIQEGAIWYFSLCRLARPVRPEWSHFCKGRDGYLLRFHWHDLSDAAPSRCHVQFHNALSWTGRHL